MKKKEKRLTISTIVSFILAIVFGIIDVKSGCKIAPFVICEIFACLCVLSLVKLLNTVDNE